jgi:hypothetical protein
LTERNGETILAGFVLEMTALSLFHRKYGEAWNPSDEELRDEFGVAYLAQGIAEQLKSTVANVSLQTKCPNLIVHVVVLPRPDTRCFVWRHDSKPSEHVLAIHYGTFASAIEIAQQPELADLVRRECKSLAAVHPDDFIRLAAYQLAFALAYHEVAHIYRGHIGFKNSPELHSETNHAAHVALWRAAMAEADADRWSSVLLAGNAISTARELRAAFLHRENEELIAHELLLVAAACLYRQFARFNVFGFPYPTIYPHPLLRATSVAIGALDNLRRTDTPSPLLLQGFRKVITGLAEAEQSTQQSDPFQQKWDIARELQAFNERYEEPLKSIGERLKEHSPERL